MGEHPNKSYLGDGAYVQQGCYHGEVILTTEDGISVQNRVVLGPQEIRALNAWIVRTIQRPERTNHEDSPDT